VKRFGGPLDVVGTWCWVRALIGNAKRGNSFFDAGEREKATWEETGCLGGGKNSRLEV